MLIINIVLLPIMFGGLYHLVKQDYQTQFVDYVRSDAQRFATHISQIWRSEAQTEISDVLDDALLLTMLVSVDILQDGESVMSRAQLEDIKKQDFHEDFLFAENDDGVYQIAIPLFTDLPDTDIILRLGYDEYPAQERIETAFRYMLYIGMSYFILTLLMIALFIPYLTRPLKALSQASHKIAEGCHEAQFIPRSRLPEVISLATDLEHMRCQLLEQQQELANYMKAIDEHALVSVADSEGRIIEVNDMFCKISGYSKEELLGQDHNIINSGTHPEAFFARLWDTISSGHKWHGETCNRAKNGVLFWVDSAIVPICNVDGVVERYITVRIDVSERKRQEDELKKAYENLAEVNSELKKMCRIDGLTNVANRRHFDETLSDEVSKLSRLSLPLTLIMCDVDYFKNYNDSYGHQAGDACLQKIAQTLKSNFFRAGDLVARYGGEEFAVILSNIDREAAVKLAERMRENVAKLKLEHNFSAVADVVTISVGVTSLIPDKNTAPSIIIKRADKALYMAKDKGRNNVQYL